MLYFQFLVVAAVFGAIAWVAAGRGGGLEDPRQDRPEPVLADERQLGKEDIDGARFAVGFRGYRMDQVDRLLDRLAAEIDHRDRLIAELTHQRSAGERFGEGVSYEPVARPQEAAAGEAAATAGAAGAAGAAGSASTITAEPGFGPGVASGPESAEAAGRDQTGADQGSAENPLSAWYRPADHEQEQ